jgi:dienelactone hydrolase
MYKRSHRGGAGVLAVILVSVICGLPANALTDPPSAAGHGNGMLRLVVEPAVALYGEPFSLRIVGAVPLGEVVVTASATDRRGTLWRSRAVFLADGAGTVDLAKTAPTSGDYGQADWGGLLWSMRSQEENNKKKGPFVRDDVYGLTVRFEANDASGAKASELLRRHVHLPGRGLVRIPLEEGGLHGFLYHPAGDGPFPSVLILGGSNGGLYEWLAQLFASNGFAALTLAYFGHRDLPRELIDIPLEYFRKATAWLKGHPRIGPDRIALVGGSKGAEAALLLASVYPDYRVVVAWVPAAHVWQGISMNPKPASSWSRGGESWPYIKWVFTPENMADYQQGKLDSFRFCYELGLKNAAPDEIENAVIPVENINAPILLVSGTDDQTWPSAEFAAEIETRLRMKRYGHPWRHVSIEGGGHMVFLPTNMITGQNRAFNGGHPRADFHGVIRSWKATLEFLHRHLEN